MTAEKIIIVTRARIVPILLVIASLWMASADSAWWLMAIPFVAVGWICAVPNLNLADGMMAYLSMIAGFILLRIHAPSGSAILTGAVAGFYLSAVEMRLSAKIYTREHSSMQNHKPRSRTSE
ncbi:MAG TPA: hypothetical protein PLA50_15255 [Bacteroidia bacterium]|nr:hypothetical protein [Bacteroidia bacterium]